MAKEKCKCRKKKAVIALSVIVVIALVIAGVNLIMLQSLIQKGNSYQAVELEDKLAPQKDENGYWVFTTDRDFKIMHLTDIHIGGGFLSKGYDEKALNAVALMVTREKPDLVIATGDICFPVPYTAGTFNNYTGAKAFGNLMESLGVYWTVTLGNHDAEAYSYYDREAVAEIYSSDEFEHCLFQAGPKDVDGYGNHVIHVKNTEGLITQELVFMDSHSYTDGDIFGIFWKYDNIHDNQVEWYRQTVQKLNAYNAALTNNPDSVVKSSAFFHIPLTEQRDAWYELMDNDYKDTENVKLIYGVAGEDGKIVYPGMGEDGLFEAMLELGSTKAVFCGHDHENNFSVEYKGIRLSYAMSVDYLAYPGIYKQGIQRGCTVITYSPDGSFDCKNENYYQDKYISLYEKEPVTMQEVTYN